MRVRETDVYRINIYGENIDETIIGSWYEVKARLIQIESDIEKFEMDDTSSFFLREKEIEIHVMKKHSSHGRWVALYDADLHSQLKYDEYYERLPYWA
jgi:hypothetical protein